MKNIILTATLSLILASAALAEQRTYHYDAAKPQNAAQALQNMQLDYAKISQIINQPGELNVSEMEQIHEISYGLEAAYEVLNAQLGVAEGVQLQQLEGLGTAIEKIHNVSENHDATATMQAHQMLGQNLLNEESLQQLQNLPALLDAFQGQ
jgi:hypothetical protein